jgi:hypothetical protein
MTHVVVPRDEKRDYGSRMLTAVVGEEGKPGAAEFCWRLLLGDAAEGGDASAATRAVGGDTWGTIH